MIIPEILSKYSNLMYNFRNHKTEGVIFLLNKFSYLLVGLVIAALDFFVPFYALKDVGSFLGSYLFWSVLTLTVIVFGVLYVDRTWGSKR